MKKIMIQGILFLGFAWGNNALCGKPFYSTPKEIRLVNNTGKDLIIYSQDGKSIMNLAPHEEKELEAKYQSDPENIMHPGTLRILTVSLKGIPFKNYYTESGIMLWPGAHANSRMGQLRYYRPDVLDTAITAKSTISYDRPSPESPKRIDKLTLYLDQQARIICDKCDDSRQLEGRLMDDMRTRSVE